MFLNNMKRLPDSIKEAFDQENFIVKKTSRVFLTMRIDQAHEQNNRAVKVDDGVIGIMDNENALLEWVLPVLYVARMACCESTNGSPSNLHEDIKSFKKEFCSRRIKLFEALKLFENTFSDPPEELMNIISKELMSAKASSSVRSALQIGQSQCNAITKERLNAVNTKPTLYATISKNNLTFFKCKAAVIASKEKKQASALKERV